MEHAWEALMEAGLPEGGIRPPAHEPLDGPLLRAALAEAMRSADLEPSRREPLLAWLLAFRRHWPESFAGLLGEGGARTIDALCARPLDENRVLKLRRIAIENLASRL